MRGATFGWLALICAGLALAIGITLFSPFASGSPDGLERVAEDEGFIDEAEDARYDVIPDYAMPGVDDDGLATVLAGVAGVGLVAGIGFALGYGPRYFQRRNGGKNGDNGPLTSSGAGSGADA